MLERHLAEVPDAAYAIMDLAEKPTTIVFDHPRGIAKNLVDADDTIAIRVASYKFCQYLINKFQKPIASASANVFGFPEPKQFRGISPEILEGVGYTVNLNQDKIIKSSFPIIRLKNNGVIKIIRA